MPWYARDQHSPWVHGVGPLALVMGSWMQGGLMSALSFSAVGESDQDRVFATLVLAFAADPVERWLYPEPQQYLSHFPKFLAARPGPRPPVCKAALAL